MATFTENVTAYRQALITQITEIPAEDILKGYKMQNALSLLASANKATNTYDNGTAATNITAYKTAIQDQIAAIPTDKVLKENKLNRLLDLLTEVNAVISA